jgi:acylphosphatase
MTDILPNDPARLHICVTGRVQSVGFRIFVQQSGNMFGLVGWVHNRGYDQVETLAEGHRDILQQFLEVVKTGPRASRIDESREEWETPTGEFERFEVR